MPFSGYSVFVRQQPLAARACGSADRPDRRPIDPIVILQVEKNGATEFYADGPTASFFAVATLFDTTESRAHSTLDPGHSNQALSGSLTGTIISSIFYLKDPAKDGQTGAFFVFSDLNVRSEGSYRLRFDLFGIHATSVSHVTHCITNTFTVYSAKRFPGMTNSTELSKTFSDQGLKIRIRKDIRVSKKLRMSEPHSAMTNSPAPITMAQKPSSSTSTSSHPGYHDSPSMLDRYTTHSNSSYNHMGAYRAAQTGSQEGSPHLSSNVIGMNFPRPSDHFQGNPPVARHLTAMTSDRWDKSRSVGVGTVKPASVQSLLSDDKMIQTRNVSGAKIPHPMGVITQSFTPSNTYTNPHNQPSSSFVAPGASDRSLHSPLFHQPPQTAKLPSFGEIFSNIHKPASLPSINIDNNEHRSDDGRRQLPSFPLPRTSSQNWLNR